ncbi:MAG: hypothetical protein WKF50_14645 [Nocardioides sp.]
MNPVSWGGLTPYAWLFLVGGVLIVLMAVAAVVEAVRDRKARR